METREFYIDSEDISLSGNKEKDYYHSFQHRKLAKYFISKLLSKLYISEDIISKCIQAPTATFARLLDIIYHKINKLPYSRLLKSGDSNCSAITMLPKKLKDKKTYDKIKAFFNQHVKRVKI